MDLLMDYTFRMLPGLLFDWSACCSYTKGVFLIQSVPVNPWIHPHARYNDTCRFVGIWRHRKYDVAAVHRQWISIARLGSDLAHCCMGHGQMAGIKT